MVAVEVDNNLFSIIELLGDEVSAGDVIEWSEDYPLGHAKVTNLTRHESFEVYFQNHEVRPHQLRQQLRME